MPATRTNTRISSVPTPGPRCVGPTGTAGSVTAGAPCRPSGRYEGSWLWHQTTESGGTLPPAYTDRTVAVHGIARLTPCGLRIENGRLQMVGTTRGDGTVS